MHNLILTQAIADTVRTPAVILTETIANVIKTPADELITGAIDYLIQGGTKILAAILIYLIGAWIIRKTRNIIRIVLKKRNIDESLCTFLLSCYSLVLFAILIVTTISILGIDTTSFVALLAGSGLAIGMALSGTLQNFAGGIMILLFKPFKIGDYIEAQGHEGKVISIEITTTHIATVDNKTIILPNGALSNGSIENYSTSGIRRCDWSIGISYGSDVAVAKKLILDIIKENSTVLNSPEKPFAALSTLGDSAVIIAARAWVNSSDYWSLYFKVNEEIYNRLPQNNISFPFPQMDIHVKEFPGKIA